MNSAAPGIGSSSCTSTPSMSVSQVSIGFCSVMAPIIPDAAGAGMSAGIAGRPAIPSLRRGCNA